MNSGNYIQTASITFGGNCSALVGSGTVNISKTTTIPIVNAAAKTGIIIDNIEFNGSGLSNTIIDETSIIDGTINDIQIYSGSAFGISV